MERDDDADCFGGVGSTHGAWSSPLVIDSWVSLVQTILSDIAVLRSSGVHRWDGSA